MKLFTTQTEPAPSPPIHAADPLLEERGAGSRGDPCAAALAEAIDHCMTRALNRTDALCQQVGLGLEALTASSQRLERLERLGLEGQRQGQRLETRLGALDTGLAALKTEQIRLGAALDHIGRQQAAVAENLDQVRLLTTELVRKTENLVDDFVQRHVEDPLWKACARLHAAWSALAEGNPADRAGEVRVQAKELERFLDEHDVALIRPQAGDPFDPRLHRPISTQPTADRGLDRRVSRTFEPGLQRRAGRLIQPARVALFDFQPLEPRPTDSVKQKDDL